MNGGSVYFLNHSTFDAVRLTGRGPHLRAPA